jgi:hypothetical protein
LQYQEIIDKLRPTLEQEGVEVEILGVKGEQLEIRAKRVGPGVPIAFLVKAIEGTLRRYHSDIREVLLSEYDPGENIPKPARNPEFDKVLHARPQVASPPSAPLGLDLSGLDRVLSLRALENAHRVFSGQGKASFMLKGLNEAPNRAAFDKWVSFYGHGKRVSGSPDSDTSTVYLTSDAPAAEPAPPEEVLWMPARVLLTGEQA